MREFTPSRYKIISGYGIAKQRLISFDFALANAGISDYNIVRASSILPAHCTEASLLDLTKGSLLLTAYGTISSNNAGDVISSAVCVALPQNPNNIGIIMETEGFCSAKDSEREVNEMAEIAMKKRNIPIQKILCSSIEYIVKECEFATVISAVSMW